MKVLHIIWNAKFGGIEKIVFELSEEQWSSDLIEPAVMIAKEEGEFLAKFKAAEFSTYFLNFNKGLDLKPSNIADALQCFKKYDVLHFHFFNPILIVAAYLSKKKIIYTEHGNFGFGRKVKKSDRFLNFIKKKILKSSRISIIYNSEFTRQYAEKYLGLSNHPRSSVVTNGINLLSYLVDQNSVREDENLNRLQAQLANRFVVGTSSRFAGFKRIDRLIDSFHKLPNNGKTVLLLVGDGVLMDELRKKVEILDLHDQIIFTGFVSKVRDYQSLMDVCVFASESEPFGLVAVETLSLGKPTIVFKDGGGLVEIIKGINSEDVVSNENELVERIEYYRSSKETNHTQHEDRIAYSKNFSIVSVAKMLVEIYQKN